MTARSVSLLVLGDREALAWVLTEGRMAFPAERAGLVGGLRPGDIAYVYTTRGCFRNPPRDRGRIIAEATITSEVATLEEPVVFGQRAFPIGCTLTVNTLAPIHQGPELAPLVGRMHAFRVPESWWAYLRRPLVPLDQQDGHLLGSELGKVAGAPEMWLPGYQQAARNGAAPTAS